MASPSGPRKAGVTCDGVIKRGKRHGQTCGMLLLAKDDPEAPPAIVCPRSQCGEHHPILTLLSKAVERGDLDKETVLAAIQHSNTTQNQQGERKMTEQTINDVNHPVVRAAATMHARIEGHCEQLERGNLVLPHRITNNPEVLERLTARAHSLRSSLFGQFFSTSLFEACGLVLEAYPSATFLAKSPDSFLSTMEYLHHQNFLFFSWLQQRDGIVEKLMVRWEPPRKIETKNLENMPLFVQITLPQITLQYEVSYIYMRGKLKLADMAGFVLKTIEGKKITLCRERILINESHGEWLQE